MLIECEWVTRSVHRLLPAQIAALLRQFVGLPTVSIEQPQVVTQALEWFEQGMDFADAIHLANCEDCEAFATFDRKFAASARKAKADKVHAL